jgi:hypothetical protein
MFFAWVFGHPLVGVCVVVGLCDTVARIAQKQSFKYRQHLDTWKNTPPVMTRPEYVCIEYHLVPTLYDKYRLVPTLYAIICYVLYKKCFFLGFLAVPW